MLRSIILIWLGSALLALAPATRAAEAPLSFGIFPNLTARQVVEIYRPLAEALERELQRRVVIFSARDFRSFVDRTREGRYDILLTAPHLAWLARQDAGYRPLLKYARPVHGLLVSRADGPYRTVAALRGATIATADPIAVTVLALEAGLAAQGLRRHVDYRSVGAGTHNNAVMQVVNGRADAAMLGAPPFLHLPPDVRRRLRIVAESPPLSSQMFLAHPRLNDREAQAIERALRSFEASPQGRAFMRRGGHGGFARVDGSELRAFRPYAMEAQAMLRSAP